jgi:hypothetical protein
MGSAEDTNRQLFHTQRSNYSKKGLAKCTVLTGSHCVYTKRERVNSYRSLIYRCPLSDRLMERASREIKKNGGAIVVYEFLGLYEGTNT